MISAAKRFVLEAAGWILLVAGVAAMVLPGPGLLLIAAGLAILSQQYEWAERRLDPVLLRGLKGAAYGVQTWPRIAASVLAALSLNGVAVLFFLRPPPPSWWPLWNRLWLPGGLGTGVTLILSSLVALGLIVYSYRRFHGKPEAIGALEGEIKEATKASYRPHPWE